MYGASVMEWWLAGGEGASSAANGDVCGKINVGIIVIAVERKSEEVNITLFGYD